MWDFKSVMLDLKSSQPLYISSLVTGHGMFVLCLLPGENVRENNHDCKLISVRYIENSNGKETQTVSDSPEQNNNNYLRGMYS